MPTIDVTNLSFSFSAQSLLGDVSLSVGEGERAVVVGSNGSGKTTLLRLVRGEITPDRGTVTIGGIPEDAPVHFPSVLSARGTVQDYLNEVLSGLRTLLARFTQLTQQLADGQGGTGLAEEYDRLLASMSAADVWSLEARGDEALAGLGLSQLAAAGRQRALETLSPGQAGRLELAGIILARPAALILDEPTNHLDDDAVAYLTDQIANWPGPVLMASHDRAFIEDSATVIYDLDTAARQALVTAEGGEALPDVYRCAGAYSDYLAAKRRAHVEHRRLHAAQQHDKRNIRMHRRRSEDIALGGVKLVTAEGMARKFFSDRAEKTALRRIRNDD